MIRPPPEHFDGDNRFFELAVLAFQVLFDYEP